MKEGLLEAWRIHNEATQMLVQQLDETALAFTLSTRGGRTVGEQLLHLLKVRRQWLAPEDKSPFPTIQSPALFIKALQQSNADVQALIERAAESGKVKGFKKGLVPFIAYLIAHESHHRGNIMLTLKVGGIKLPDAVKWGMWDWNKL